MITTQSLTKSFKNGKVISYDDSQFDTGVNLIRGSNGSGKSTLLKMIAGVDSKYDGQVRETTQNLDISSEALKKLKTYLPDTPTFFNKSTAMQLLSSISKLRNVDIDERVHFLTSRLNFQAEALNNKFEALSLGQKKKLFLAISLLPKTKYWILDEPENGLDKSTVEEFRNILNENSKEKTIIMTSHLMNTDDCVENCKIIDLSSEDNA